MIATGKALIGYTIMVGTLYTGQAVLDVAVPASIWFEVHSIKVRDSVEGVAPEMVVERDINRQFHGEWKAEVEQLNEAGDFTVVCQAHGNNNYSPDNRLPVKLDLDWWTFPVKCVLSAGKYRTDTTWRVLPTGITPRYVNYVSNVFEIKKVTP